MEVQGNLCYLQNQRRGITFSGRYAHFNISVMAICSSELEFPFSFIRIVGNADLSYAICSGFFGNCVYGDDNDVVYCL